MVDTAIRAKSCDIDLARLIANARFMGFIHSVFDKTVNIRCSETDSLYALAASTDNAPNTLIVDGNSFSGFGLETGDKVTVQNKTLSISNKLTVMTDGIVPWRGCLPVYPADISILKANLALMEQYLNTCGKCGGIKTESVSSNNFTNETGRVLYERSQMLVFEGLLNKDMTIAFEQAIGMIGLGAGLTPSGDDFLAGLFAVFNIKNSPCNIFTPFCVQVAARAGELTNDISYTMLRAASDGKVRQSIVTLLHCLLYGDKTMLLPALRDVLDIGSCSGTDIAFGIMRGLELNLRLAAD